MDEKTYNLIFRGYIREENIYSLPSTSGVYVVYRCYFDKALHAVSLNELLYIGKADDLNTRINKHEDWDEWGRKLHPGEQLCFCYTIVTGLENERVEAALINSNQTRLNKEYKNAFPFDKTIVNCAGGYSIIKTLNIVYRQ